MLLISILLVGLLNIFITKNFDRLQDILDSHKQFRGKMVLRRLYNANSIVNAFVMYLINTARGAFYRGNYGGEVEYLLVYPIKSVGRGVRVKSWDMADYGLRGDRVYMLTTWNEEKQLWDMISMKQCLKLSTVELEFDEESKEFVFTYADPKGEKKFFRLPLEVDDCFVKKYSSAGTAKEYRIKIWSFRMLGYNLDRFLPAEFVESMGLPADTTLMCSADGKPCTVGVPNGNSKRRTIFQDCYPILMTSEEDLHWLKDACQSVGDAEHLRMESFRPNIVIKDTPRPFVDDLYHTFDIVSPDGESRHRFQAPLRCIRCTLPNIDYKHGKLDESSVVTKTLSKHRRVDEANPHKSCFGKYAINLDEGYTINAGDKLDVLLYKCTFWEEDPYDV